MEVRHVLAVVPVAGLVRANAFYEALFGGRATNAPLPTLIEWKVTDGGWVQVAVDAERAGHGRLDLAVRDLAAAREELLGRGLAPAPAEPVSRGVERSTLRDPDGNAITLIGGFRKVY